MRLILVATLSLVVAACGGQSEAEVLESSYRDRAERMASADKCAEGREIASAWAREGNQEKHDSWTRRADVECLHAGALAGAGLS